MPAKVGTVAPLEFRHMNVGVLDAMSRTMATVENHRASGVPCTPEVIASARRTAKSIMARRADMPNTPETGAIIDMCICVLHFVGE